MLTRVTKFVSAWLFDLMFLAGFAVASVELEEVIESRDSLDRARDVHRNPKETIRFFEIQPGMTVVETLPGRGWYTKILVPYIGENGRFFGANYTNSLMERVMGKRWESRREAIEKWLDTFPAWAESYAMKPPKIGAFHISLAPKNLIGQVDRVLFIRSLHHLNRFDTKILDAAATEAFSLLKPGGIVGVVQHRAPENSSDVWANGDNGYLKQTRVTEAFESAGFHLVGSIEINANPMDQPTEDDRVWRLPPALSTEDRYKESNKAIGESDRMTLKFRKPI